MVSERIYPSPHPSPIHISEYQHFIVTKVRDEGKFEQIKFFFQVYIICLIKKPDKQTSLFYIICKHTLK